MKRILGLLLILVAIVGGLYVGGWIFFFKAIVEIIEAVKAGWIAISIAEGLCKIFLGIPAVEFIAFTMFTIGLRILID